MSAGQGTALPQGIKVQHCCWMSMYRLVHTMQGNVLLLYVTATVCQGTVVLQKIRVVNQVTAQLLRIKAFHFIFISSHYTAAVHQPSYLPI